jgi:hypothetical protein
MKYRLPAAAMFMLSLITPATRGEDPVTLLVLEPDQAYPRHSEGSMVALDGGGLGLIYSRFTGGAGDDAAADIVMLESDTAGQNWGAPRVLVPRGRGGLNVMSVSSARLPGGDWLLFYLRKESWSECNLFVSRSSDGFGTLSPPVRVTTVNGYHVVNNDRVTITSSGRLVVPSALHPCPDGTRKSWSPAAHPMAFLSDDQGRTWRRAAEPVGLPADPSLQLQEPGVVELAGGRLLMYMRTNRDVIYQAFSEDGGEHWTTAEPGPLVSARLSPATIRRLPWDKRLVCVWNDHSDRPGPPSGRRTPLCIATSRDDGRSWSRSRPLETGPDGWYCYTSIGFAGDRVILSYCAGDKKVGGLSRLKVVALPRRWLDEIAAGGPATQAVSRPAAPAYP